MGNQIGLISGEYNSPRAPGVDPQLRLFRFVRGRPFKVDAVSQCRKSPVVGIADRVEHLRRAEPVEGDGGAAQETDDTGG